MSMLKTLMKILLGALLLIGSIAYVFSNQYGAWTDLLTVINGVVPAFVGLIGFFIIWLELDEMKVKSRKKKK